MLLLNRLAVIWLVVVLLGPFAPLEARTRKGDKLLAQGKQAELKKDWDTALDFYEQALSEDPGDVGYQIAAGGARFQASQAHLDRGLKIRSMVLPDVFIDQDSPNAMYAKAGLDEKSIVAKAFGALGQNIHGDVVKLVRS